MYGMRPTATSSISASNVTASPLAFLPETLTPFLLFSSLSSLMPVSHLMPCFLKLRSKFFRNIGVLDRHDAVEQFDDRRVAAKPRINARKFNADRTRAHHDHRFWHVGQFENMIGIDDLLAVGFKTGDRPYDRAGGDDDVLWFRSFLFAVGESDLDLALCPLSCQSR